MNRARARPPRACLPAEPTRTTLRTSTLSTRGDKKSTWDQDENTSVISVVGLSLQPWWGFLLAKSAFGKEKCRRSKPEGRAAFSRCVRNGRAHLHLDILSHLLPAPRVSQVASSPSEGSSGDWLDWLCGSHIPKIFLSQGNLVGPEAVSPLLQILGVGGVLTGKEE